MMSLGRIARGVGLGAVGVGRLILSAPGELAEAFWDKDPDEKLTGGIWMFGGALLCLVECFVEVCVFCDLGDFCDL